VKCNAQENRKKNQFSQPSKFSILTRLPFIFFQHPNQPNQTTGNKNSNGGEFGNGCYTEKSAGG